MEGFRAMSVAVPMQGRHGLLMSVLGMVNFSFSQEAGHGAQRRQEVGAVGVADLATVFVVGSIPNVMVAVLDAPVASGDLQQGLGVFLLVGLRRQAGNRQDGLVALPAAGEIVEVPMNSRDLRGAKKARLFRRCAQGPDFPGLQASVVLLQGLGLRRVLRGKKRC